MNRDLAEEIVDRDGQWVFSEGAEWRLDVECDQDVSINDYDCYGRVAWARDSIDTGWSQRPHDFGPHSRILDRGGWHGTLWWEPYDWREATKHRDFEAEFKTAKRLWEDGFALMHLQRREFCLHCNTWGNETETYLGGIDVWPWDEGGHDYWVDLVKDSAPDIEPELTVEEAHGA